MTGTRPLRIGVVGLGYWGPNIARNIAWSNETELTWLCDLDEGNLAEHGRRYPSARTTTRYHDLLEDPGTDAVAIVTSVSTHYALAKEAIAAGKHVFVEKPLASSSTEAEELLGLAARQGLVLQPGHTFLYSPPVMRIKELLDSGSIGSVHFISMSRVNLGLHQPDASVIWDLGPHDFSILRYWLGELPVEVTALSRSCIMPGNPDVAFINMRFADGVIAHAELSWLSPSKLRRTAIVGSDKTVIYDDTSPEPVRIFDSGASLPPPESFGEFRMSYRTGDITSPKIPGTEPLALEIEDFARCAREGREPRSSALVGLDVIRVIEAVDHSLRAGGAPARVHPSPARVALDVDHAA